MKTDQLIADLTRNLQPVAPLATPGRRALLWLVGATAGLAAMTALLTSADDVASNARVPFLIAQGLTALASVTAAVAACASVIPGHSRRVLLLPGTAVAVWVLALLGSALQEPVPPGGASNREWLCVLLIVAGGSVPAAALARLLRAGAPVMPRVTGGLAVLAAAALASIAACVSHPHPNSLSTLAWHGVTIALLVVLGVLAGPRVFRWRRSTLFA